MDCEKVGMLCVQLGAGRAKTSDIIDHGVGFEVHKKQLGDDLSKRRSILDSERYVVWSVTWDDLIDDRAMEMTKGKVDSYFGSMEGLPELSSPTEFFNIFSESRIGFLDEVKEKMESGELPLNEALFIGIPSIEQILDDITDETIEGTKDHIQDVWKSVKRNSKGEKRSFFRRYGRYPLSTSNPLSFRLLCVC